MSYLPFIMLCEMSYLPFIMLCEMSYLPFIMLYEMSYLPFIMLYEMYPVDHVSPCYFVFFCILLVHNLYSCTNVHIVSQNFCKIKSK